MPSVIKPFLTPNARRTALWLSVLLPLLSGCAGHSLVPDDELEADRQQRQALQVRQDELLVTQEELLVKQEALLEQIISLTSVQGKLEASLAGETAKRESLERQIADANQQREAMAQHQEKLERYMQAQQSAADEVKRLTLQLEQWRRQDRERQAAVTQKMNEDDAELYLQLLEKNARLARLSDQLGEAILEVVRTKAKLRSLESRAEAASDLAEAEIAIQALISRGQGMETDPGVIKARELNALSAREFDQGNYGGALYLTGQAKSAIKSVEARSVGQEAHSMVKGEKAFALPLPLKLRRDSQMRQGPDDRSEVALSLPKGTDLIGYSYKGQWVHVKTMDGAGGWVYYRNLASSD